VRDATDTTFATWNDSDFDGAAAWGNMHRTFASVAAAHPEQVCVAWFRFAGRPVRLCVVGRELFRHIVRPFAHLRDGESTGADLTIEIWDDRLRGVLPMPERSNGHALWREATLRSGDGRYFAQQLPHTRSCLDRRDRHIVAGIAWHDAIFIYERSKPFARLLLTWYNDREVQLIHAGLVARDGVGVLLAGKSGSGKSTCALASVDGGLDFLSEDYLGLETRPGGKFVGHSVYNSLFLNSSHLARFPALAPHAINGRPPQEEKSVVSLSALYAQRLARRADIHALVFPRVADADCAHMAPMSKAAALLAFAPSSLLQIPNRYLGAAGFDRLAELVERLPCFVMTMGSRLDSIAPCLDALIARVSAGAIPLRGSLCG
jgi:hypothetical protein